jgi:HPt (histidine-containing phosphotransfer) domain-containing protein
MINQAPGLEKYEPIPALDVETIEMLKHHAGGNMDILKDLLESFFPEAEEQINELYESAEKNDTEMFKRCAHGLSGISATIGATQLKTLSVDMEMLAKAGEFDEAYKLLEYVNSFYERFVGKAQEMIFS